MLAEHIRTELQQQLFFLIPNFIHSTFDLPSSFDYSFDESVKNNTVYR